MDERALLGGNTTVSSSLDGAKAVKDSPIGNASNQLQKAQAVLEDELGMLLDQLRPILTPVDSVTENDRNPEPPRSDVADLIFRQAYKASSMASFVRSIRERIEL